MSLILNKKYILLVQIPCLSVELFKLNYSRKILSQIKIGGICVQYLLYYFANSQQINKETPVKEKLIST